MRKQKIASDWIAPRRALVIQKVNSSHIGSRPVYVARGDETLPRTPSRADEILAQAASCFAHQGFHGVSMRDLAKANDCSVATLYNHFPNKEALLLAIGQRLFTVVIADLRVGVNAPTDGLTRLAHMVQVTVADCFRYRAEFLSFTHDRRHVRTTPELYPLVEAQNTCIGLWRRVLTEGMRDGSIRNDVDADAAIRVLLSVITGIVDADRPPQLALTEAGPDLAGEVPSLISILIDGLRPQL